MARQVSLTAFGIYGGREGVCQPLDIRVCSKSLVDNEI